MVKRLPNWLKIGLQAGFGPNFTVEFVPVFQKKIGVAYCISISKVIRIITISNLVTVLKRFECVPIKDIRRYQTFKPVGGVFALTIFIIMLYTLLCTLRRGTKDFFVLRLLWLWFHVNI